MRAGRFCTVLVALIAVSGAAPHKRITFHKHTEDFIGLIVAKSGLDIELLFKQYGESKEMGFTLTYLKSTQFRDLFHEIQTIPEFNAVIDYLDNANIDARRIINRVNELFEFNENVDLKRLKSKNSEMTLSSFMRESIELFPKDDLAKLFKEKKEKYPLFRDSVQKLHSKEWDRTLGALWTNEKFERSVKTMAEKGFDVRLLITLIGAMFGQI